MATASSTSSSTLPLSPPSDDTLPHIHLLCMQTSASTAFFSALQSHSLTTSIPHTIHTTHLSNLPSNLTFDLVVSPANSYARLDGGFDDAISRAWSPPSNYHALTNHCQSELYRSHLGYLPPGSCEIIRIPESFRGKLRYNDGRGWGCKYIALCPTMRIPQEVNWDRDVVYECIWSLFCAIRRHNREQSERSERSEPNERAEHEGKKIRSILMTPLATGCGGVSNKKWAEQCCLAMKHYLDATGDGEERWKQLNWHEIQDFDRDVEATYE